MSIRHNGLIISNTNIIDSIKVHGVASTVDANKAVDLSVVEQVNTLPIAGVDYLGRVVQFIGTDSGSFTHNYFYECTGTTSIDGVDVLDCDPIYSVTITDSQKMEDGLEGASSSLGVEIVKFRFELSVMGGTMKYDVIAYEADDTPHSYITEESESTLSSTYGFSLSTTGPGQQLGDGFVIGYTYETTYEWEQTDVQTIPEVATISNAEIDEIWS